MTWPWLDVTVVTGDVGPGRTDVARSAVAAACAAGEDVAVLVAGPESSTFPGATLVVTTEEEVVERCPACSCCAVRLDLIRVLRTLAEQRPRLDRVVVATGEATDVATLEQTLMGDPDLRRLAVLDGVVFVADGPTWSVRRRWPAEDAAMADQQLALADAVVVVGSERLTAEGRRALHQLLRDRNRDASLQFGCAGPGERCVLIDLGRSDPARFAERLSPTPAGATDLNRAGLHSIALEVPGLLDPSMVEAWVDDLLDAHGAELLRFRAVLSVAGPTGVPLREVYRVVRRHLERDVDHTWRQGEPALSRLALVGYGLDAPGLRSSLTGCLRA